jgi:hypothetical protein
MYAKLTTAPVCEYCTVQPAHGGTKYCEDCAAKLEKDLGLVDEGDEEKNADSVGGGAEPSTAPGVSVEPTSAAPEVSVERSPDAPDGSVEQGTAAASQTARVCIVCNEPATNGRFCAACDANVLADLKTWKDAGRKVNQLKREAVDATIAEYAQETKRCVQCKSVRIRMGLYCEDCNGRL